MTSGARYSGVPQNVDVVAPYEISSLHSPKSVICKKMVSVEHQLSNRIDTQDQETSTETRNIISLTSYLDVALAVEQQVFELEVTIDDTLGVQVCDGQRDLTSIEPPALLTKLAITLQVVEDLQGKKKYKYNKP